MKFVPDSMSSISGEQVIPASAGDPELEPELASTPEEEPDPAPELDAEPELELDADPEADDEPELDVAPELEAEPEPDVELAEPELDPVELCCEPASGSLTHKFERQVSVPLQVWFG